MTDDCEPGAEPGIRRALLWGLPVAAIADAHARHRAEVERYGDAVAGDRVRFVGLTYAELLAGWQASAQPQLRAHVAAIRAFFGDAF
jgi:methyl coenzyme M reductase gamma subunit